MASKLLEELKELLSDELKGLAEEGQAQLGDLKGFVEEIAPEILKWAQADPEDQRRNMRHLKAQALMVAGIKAVHIRDTLLERAVSITARVLGIALKAAL